MSRRGPDAPCQRTACAETAPHLAGRHLDPRDALYDGPHSALRTLPLAVRDSARRLVTMATATGDVPEVMDLVQHIHFLRDQVAAVRVDGDRRERAALLRSASCEEHGKEIEELGQQIDAVSRQADANDAGRVALLGLLHAVEDFVRSHRGGGTPGDLTVKDVVDALDKASKRAAAAHTRAWKK